MTRFDIERYLYAGRGVVVDVRPVEGAPGHVRTVTLHRALRVTIEYQRSREYVDNDSEGGGPKYTATYASLDELLRDLEHFLGTPMEAWQNFSSNPFVPPVLEDPDPGKSLGFFEELVRNARVPLPSGALFEPADLYFRHVAKYGRYRPDLLEEEEAESLRRFRGPDRE